MRELHLLVLILSIHVSQSQELELHDYLFPINPGQQNYLSGTVGEIRYSHFHTGIDVKTGGKTGLPVYATKDGFISRVKVSPVGYGNTIYMQHPDGWYSVYAHLESFEKKIDKWVTEKQYQKETFAIDIYPAKNQFTFKRGDIIGYSGNSGSSSGPHLHFEIRDPNNNPIDVLALGFQEISDNIPPVVKKIAFITLSEDARINDYFGRQEFELVKKGTYYTTSIPVHLRGKIGIEIYSYDPMNGVTNRNGIVETELKIDEVTYFKEVKKKLSFATQRSTLVHYNYCATKKGSGKFNKLYLSDGNELSFYEEINHGIVFENQNKIEIATTDSHGNTSLTKIELIEKPGNVKPWISQMELTENYLHLRSTQSVSIKLSEWKSLKPYKSSGVDSYFIWDLRKGTPGSIFLNGETIKTGYTATLPSYQQMNYIHKDFEMTLSSRSLFDTLYLSFEKEYDSIRKLELFHYKNKIDPIRSTITMKLKLEKAYHIDAAVYSIIGKRYKYIGGDWKNGNITFSTRELVTYTVLHDSIPPKITPKLVSQDHLKFRIKDDLSGIKSFKGEMNGEFVLMNYDPKRNMIWSKKRNRNIPFEGEFILQVIDNSNNKTTYTNRL
ncbi:MAG: M23 family metallopeptidase [Bacteroidota bacterium]